MGKTTQIQWCHSTVNPVMGCDGCELWDLKNNVKRCYAGILTERYAGTNKGYPASFEDVTMFPGRMATAAKWGPPTEAERLAKPWLPKNRRVIFVSDMGDALSQSVPFDYLQSEILDGVSLADSDGPIFMWLTKRAAMLAEFDRELAEKGISWPENLWVGTSVTSQASARRVADLVKVRAAVHFISGEPQKEFVDISQIPGCESIDLWLQGGASGPDSELFNPDWARQWRDWCAKNRTAYFLKQLGANVAGMSLRHSHGGDWNEWPSDLRVRQFPEVSRG